MQEITLTFSRQEFETLEDAMTAAITLHADENNGDLETLSRFVRLQQSVADQIATL